MAPRCPKGKQRFPAKTGKCFKKDGSDIMSAEDVEKEIKRLKAEIKAGRESSGLKPSQIKQITGLKRITAGKARKAVGNVYMDREAVRLKKAAENMAKREKAEAEAKAKKEEEERKKKAAEEAERKKKQEEEKKRDAEIRKKDKDKIEKEYEEALEFARKKSYATWASFSVSTEDFLDWISGEPAFPSEGSSVAKFKKNLKDIDDEGGVSVSLYVPSEKAILEARKMGWKKKDLPRFYYAVFRSSDGDEWEGYSFIPKYLPYGRSEDDDYEDELEDDDYEPNDTPDFIIPKRIPRF